jgi:hypothetical protein
MNFQTNPVGREVQRSSIFRPHQPKFHDHVLLVNYPWAATYTLDHISSEKIFGAILTIEKSRLRRVEKEIGSSLPLSGTHG